MTKKRKTPSGLEGVYRKDGIEWNVIERYLHQNYGKVTIVGQPEANIKRATDLCFGVYFYDQGKFTLLH